jgi:predicted RNA-binding Zn ribbon-like protein
MSRSGHEWWFDSGSLALDFAYTGAMGNDSRWERLHAAEDLAAWLHERFENVDGTVGEGDLRDGLALRGAIASAVASVARGGVVPPEDVDVINLFAATPDIPPSLPGGTRQAGRTTARAGQALSELAREAVALLAAGRDRFRECSADECELVFYDDSRSNNRRWCSMQRCGNRAKVRAFRGR